MSLAEIILGYASVYLAGFHAYKILPDAHWTEYNQMRLFAETVRNLAYSYLLKFHDFHWELQCLSLLTQAMKMMLSGTGTRFMKRNSEQE